MSRNQKEFCCDDAYRETRIQSNLTLLGISFIFTFFVAVLGILFYEDTFNPDEAFLLNYIEQSGGFWEFNKIYDGGFFLTRLVFFHLKHIFGFGVKGHQMVSIAFSIMTFWYLIFLSRDRYLFRGYTLIVLTFLYATNSIVIAFGTWGFYVYSQTVFVSLFFIHLVLAIDLRDLHPSRMFFLSMMFAFLVGYLVHLVLPITVLLFTIYLKHLLDNRLGLKESLRSAGKPIVLGLPMLIIGLLLLFAFPHVQFREPRSGVWPYYFVRSGFPQTVSGALEFAMARCLTLFSSVFDIYDGTWTQAIRDESFLPDPGPDTVIGIVGFLIGATKSLLMPRSRRFPIALFTVLTLISLISLSFLNLFAFGQARYSLFIHIPLIFLCGLGLIDLLSGVAWGFDRLGLNVAGSSGWKWTKAIVFGSALTVGLMRMGIVIQPIVERADKYNERFKEVLDTLDNDDSEAIAVDIYTRELIKTVRPNFLGNHVFTLPWRFQVEGMKKKILEENLEEWGRFLQFHGSVLIVTTYPYDEDYRDFFWVARESFRQERLPSVSRWHLSRLERMTGDENFLVNPSDFSKWAINGKVAIENDPLPQVEGGNEARYLQLEPGANLYHSIPSPTKAGMDLFGEVWVKSDIPTTIGLSLERDGATTPEGSPRKWIEVSENPIRIFVSHRFKYDHKFVRLRLWAPEDSPSAFHAWNARIYATPESTSKNQ